MIRRSKATWLELINEFEVSGLSAAEFCRRKNLSPKYFSTRRVALRKAAAKPNFVQAKPMTSNHCDKTHVVVRVVELSVPLEQLSSVLSSLR